MPQQEGQKNGMFSQSGRVVVGLTNIFKRYYRDVMTDSSVLYTRAYSSIVQFSPGLPTLARTIMGKKNATTPE